MASVERTVMDDAVGMTAEAQVVSKLLTDRFSCRAFRDEPVPHDLIQTMLALAQRAASWCNTQPWQVHVTEGEATERFRNELYSRATEDLSAGVVSADTDFAFPAAYTGVYKQRQREVGWQLYDAVGVAYGDRKASGLQALENFRLFGAPHALVMTTERDLGVYGVLDCGSYLGTLMLAAQSLRIAMIAQAALATYSPFLHEFFDIPENRAIVCGASFGYADLDHAANSFRSRRALPDESITWMSK